MAATTIMMMQSAGCGILSNKKYNNNNTNSAIMKKMGTTTTTTRTTAMMECWSKKYSKLAATQVGGSSRVRKVIRGSVRVQASAADRDLWLPGSTPPAHLGWGG